MIYYTKKIMLAMLSVLIISMMLSCGANKESVTADFAYTIDYSTGEPVVKFTNTSSVNSPIKLTFSSAYWDFGDGVTSTEFNPVHMYVSTDTSYSVNLIMRTSKNDIVVTSKEVSFILPEFVQIAAGYSHTIAIRSDGTLWAWGNNTYGRLGFDTDNLSQLTPKQVGSKSNWVKVSAGNAHTLAIDSDGFLFAWGENFHGQTGLGEGSCVVVDGVQCPVTTPTQVGSDRWLDVSAGHLFSMGINIDGKLFGWGNNSASQLGFPTLPDGSGLWRVWTPTQSGTFNDWEQVSAGSFSTLAIRDNGKLYGWGANGYGQLGLGASRVGPYDVAPEYVSDGWKQVSAGGVHSLGVTLGGKLYGWGNNGSSQIGIDSSPEIFLPIPTLIGDSSLNWKQVSGREYSSLAISSTGALFAWGSNEYSQLGSSTPIVVNTPRQVGTETDWSHISAGFFFTLGLRGMAAYGWGENNEGQIGVGSINNIIDTPTRVK